MDMLESREMAEQIDWWEKTPVDLLEMTDRQIDWQAK